MHPDRAYRHSFPLTALFPDRLQVGSDRYKVLCPVHQEAHASCVLNKHREHGWRWHCFACGADGDALDVLTQRDGLGWREALEVLGGGESSARIDLPGSPRLGVAANLGSGLTAAASVLVCDACRHETLTVTPRTYRTIGKRGYEYETSVEAEALAAGWELGQVNACVGPVCLDGQAQVR